MDPSNNSDVSVVILTRNSARTLERCLESVVREDPSEIIAVDGLSTDETRGILRRYGVKVIIDPTGSLGHSRQLGVEAAAGIYVMFVDSDVRLGVDCIHRLRRDLEEHGWGGVAARVLSAENASYWQKAEEEIVSFSFPRHYDVDGSSREFVDTRAALFKRGLLLRYAFDSYFKPSAEDQDLGRRLLEDGYQLGVSDAIIYHFHRREFFAFMRQRFRWGLGTARLGVKYGDMGICLALCLTPLITALSETIRTIAAGSSYLVPYWLCNGLAQSLGVVVGLRSARSSFKRTQVGRSGSSQAGENESGVHALRNGQ
jgi:glycosyltransferase involved in cell wall biosynthesis